jgi:hypothetical protein
MDGRPREAEARDQPEFTFTFQKDWHFRMDNYPSNFAGSILLLIGRHFQRSSLDGQNPLLLYL